MCKQKIMVLTDHANIHYDSFINNYFSYIVPKEDYFYKWQLI